MQAARYYLMKLTTVFIFSLLILFSFSFKAKGGITSITDNQSDSLPHKILIINSFDAMSMKARKNKKELYAELADSMKEVFYTCIHGIHEIPVTIIPEHLKEMKNPDSSIFLLMVNNNASGAIIINNIDAYFNQTGVEVTGEKNNKTRTAFYDICVVITYSLYDREKRLDRSEVRDCEFYTKRNVVSGLLATGPDVVGKRKDVYRMLAMNVKTSCENIRPDFFGN